ncbi:MAG: 3-isopropylmalate dehydratase large subunit [Candidatus Zixiibacteriota bacterium]|nr:MAG: 3-isopropylmalate dehydratase large subunit [candidate division Zixibacteria bacterium]
MSPRRKMPTKAELLQLQKLYRTDENIGERLGGVPAYLVAYWRRKKNVPKHSQPKFSESEIRNLWERFGDDDRCGLELGISKAAFYNWRRRYGIREKPAFLKLEQLELNLPGMDLRNHIVPLYGKQTTTQKILAQSAGLDKVKVGELVVVEPNVVIVNKDFGKIIRTFKEIGVEYVWNPARIIISLDGNSGSTGEDSTDYKLAREFARRQKIDNFYDFHKGTSHQLAIENGHILPGQLVLGTDRYAVSLGALGAFAVSIDATEMATVLASGRIWLKVPSSIRIDISGRRPRGVYTGDIVLAVIKQLGTTRAEYRTIEYYGRAVASMSMSERTTLCYLSAEMGPKAAMCSFEAITRRYLTGRTNTSYKPVIADKDTVFDEVYQFNIDRLTPQIAGPNVINTIKPVRELEGLSIQQIIIGTCSNGRFDDLRVVANILKGNKVDSQCRLIVMPASHKVYLEALKKGLIRILAEAGAMVISSTNMSIAGEFQRTLAPGERCLTTSVSAIANSEKNNGTEIYFCSPATAAASALNGRITNPEPYVK